LGAVSCSLNPEQKQIGLTAQESLGAKEEGGKVTAAVGGDMGDGWRALALLRLEKAAKCDCV
jgi:hypothetical protein